MPDPDTAVGEGRPETHPHPRTPSPRVSRPGHPHLDRLGVVGAEAPAVHLLHGPTGLRAACELDEGDALRLLRVLVPHHPDILDLAEGGEALPQDRLGRVLADHQEDAAVGRLVQAVHARAEASAARTAACFVHGVPPDAGARPSRLQLSWLPPGPPPPPSHTWPLRIRRSASGRRKSLALSRCARPPASG